MDLGTMDTLSLLSVIIPARDEEDCIASTVEHLFVELRLRGVPHEIVVVDDGSTDKTWNSLKEARERIPTLVLLQNSLLHGFGRAVVCGLDNSKGDAVVVMMADESDDSRDVVTYWKVLKEGYDCVFGSRFVKGGGAIDYPLVKLALNRLANFFIRILFGIQLNDTTNAFKAYRRSVIDGCRPFLSAHFNLTIEIPLKAIVKKIQLEGCAHHVAQSTKRRPEAKDQGDGKPLFIRLPLRLAGKVPQQGRTRGAVLINTPGKQGPPNATRASRTVVIKCFIQEAWTGLVYDNRFPSPT